MQAIKTWLKNQVKWHLLPARNKITLYITRKRIKKRICGKNNKLDVKHSKRASIISIEGDENRMIISKDIKLGSMNLKIYGDRNTLIVNDRVCIDDVQIIFNGNDCMIEIDSDTYISNGTLLCAESDTYIKIGKHCMFAYGFEIRTGDSHGIFDKNTHERLNPGKSIDIGQHVWLGNRVLVLKGGSIPNGCIVGAHSIVSKPLSKKDALYAGSPVKLLKEDIAWSWHLTQI